MDRRAGNGISSASLATWSSGRGKNLIELGRPISLSPLLGGLLSIYVPELMYCKIICPISRRAGYHPGNVGSPLGHGFLLGLEVCCCWPLASE